MSSSAPPKGSVDGVHDEDSVRGVKRKGGSAYFTAPKRFKKKGNRKINTRIQRSVGNHEDFQAFLKYKFATKSVRDCLTIKMYEGTCVLEGEQELLAGFYYLGSFGTVTPSKRLLEQQYATLETADMAWLPNGARLMYVSGEKSDKVDPALLLLREEALWLFIQYLPRAIDMLKMEEYTDQTQLYRYFCRLDPTFFGSWTAFRHYRFRGWVPKSGLRMATDFTLYPDGGPLKWHAPYSVLVRVISADGKSEFDHMNRTRELSWARMLGLARQNEQAVKETLLVLVTVPADLSDKEVRMSLTLAEKCQVEEIIITRWVADRNRE
eukprot:Clim_evm64s152 gene=Clim_evmTU64s152